MLNPDRLTVVLVSPRNPLNIGAAARAMANFGFSNLVVVAPYEPHWREAKSAVGAEKLLEEARCTPSLAEAIADCTLVLGTAAPTRRRPEQPVVSLPDLVPIVQQEISRGGRVALVFGPEKRGLTRQDLSYCHVLLEIPTDPRQPSMNLAQAVAVCLYELSVPRSDPAQTHQPAAATRAPDFVSAPSRQSDLPTDPPATTADLHRLALIIEQTMLAANYSPPAMRNANRHHLHLFLRRLAFTRSDCRRVLGLFRRILWNLERPASKPKT